MPYKYCLYVLGNNEHIQLGLGPASATNMHVSTLTKVQRPPPKYNQRILSIHCGATHTLLRTETGAVHGAGRNKERQLGYRLRTKNSNINSTLASNSGCLVEFDKMYRKISFCAATERTSAYIVNPGMEGNTTNKPLLFTEGKNYNSDGELGRNNWDTTEGIISPESHRPFNPRTDRTSDQWDPVGLVPFDSWPAANVIDLAAGLHHYVAILDDGSVWGWGAAKNGQLGLPVRFQFPEGVKHPHNISPSTLTFRPRKAVCGMSFTLLAGDPATGEYMIMGPPEKPVMTTAPTDIKNWKTIGATWRGVVVLFQDGTLTGWGQTFKFRLVPENLPLLQQIAVGTEHVVAVTNHDNVIAWGWNEHGNCGADEGTKYFDNSWNMITGYKGTVDFIAAGWATTFIVTRERDDRSGEAKIWRMKNRTKRLNPKKDRKYKDGSSGASSSKMGLTTSNANL